MQPHCRTVSHLLPLPPKGPSRQLKSEASAKSAATPPPLHPSSLPIEHFPSLQPDILDGRLIWLRRRCAGARTCRPSNQHVTARFGSSIGRGLLRGGPPSINGNPRVVVCIGELTQETNVPACPRWGAGGAAALSQGVSAAKSSQGSVSCARETHGLRRRFVSMIAFPACWDVGGCMCHRPSAPVLRVANHCLRITKRPDRPCEKPGHGTFWFRVPALAATRRHSGLRRALHIGSPRKWATATLQFQHASLAFRSRSRSSGNLSGSASRAYHWQVESVR
jgi:hypothetical protein